MIGPKSLRKYVPVLVLIVSSGIYASLLLSPSPANAWGADICACILGEIADVQNDIAAGLLYRKCSDRDKCSNKSSSWFSMSFTDCLLKYGKNKRNDSTALALVAMACSARYGT
jgi:hypothetical protein